MSCYTGFFNVRRGWQSLNTGPRFYLRLIRRTGWLWISTSRTTDGRPFKQKKLSVPFLYPGVPAGLIYKKNRVVDLLLTLSQWKFDCEYFIVCTLFYCTKLFHYKILLCLRKEHLHIPTLLVDFLSAPAFLMPTPVPFTRIPGVYNISSGKHLKKNTMRRSFKNHWLDS